LKILLRSADISIMDSDGRDAFMYVAMKNHTNTFNFILGALKQKDL
jgi:ankyrin repeat protein